jgi:hypothetical protein
MNEEQYWCRGVQIPALWKTERNSTDFRCGNQDGLIPRRGVMKKLVTRLTKTSIPGWSFHYFHPASTWALKPGEADADSKKVSELKIPLKNNGLTLESFQFGRGRTRACQGIQPGVH